jgi:PBSX family phage terminase large subunit
MHAYTDPGDNFIVTSPTYKIFAQSTLPPFLKYNEGIGHYDKKNECFEIYGGGTVWFRTGTDPDSVVGITDVRAILCDEAGKYSRYFWDNIQARSAFKEAPIMIVTSPYSLNWLYTDYIRKHQKEDPYVLEQSMLIQASSKENPYFSNEEYERKRRTTPPRRFNMTYGGAFEKAEGLVYDCFDQKIHVIQPFKLPEGTRYFAGVDWGFTHPFVITVRAVTPTGRHYKVDEFYKTKQTEKSMIEHACRLNGLWPIERFYCDPARPEYIRSFCMAGLKATAGNNAIRKGIDDHWELINDHRYFMFKGSSKDGLDEYEQYHYPEEKDKDPNRDEKDQLPVDQFNHVMDAERYVTAATLKIGNFKKPARIRKEKSETNTAFIPRDLKRDKLLRQKKKLPGREHFE